MLGVGHCVRRCCITGKVSYFKISLFYLQYCRKITYSNNRKNTEYCQDNWPGLVIGLPLVMIMWLNHWQSANANSYWYQQTPLHSSFILFMWILYLFYIFSVQLKEKGKVKRTYIIHHHQLKNSCILPPMKHTLLIINLKLKPLWISIDLTQQISTKLNSIGPLMKLPRTVYSSKNILSKTSLQGWSGCQKSDLTV